MRSVNNINPTAMTLPKALLPLLATSAFLGGCVYEETTTSYQHPRRVYNGGYVERDVVVDRRSDYYDQDRSRGYYRQRPVTVYEDRPRAYYDDRSGYDDHSRSYGGGYAVIEGRHGESSEEHRKRELRESQRAQEERHDKKDDDHKKKKKKDHDDDR